MARTIGINNVSAVEFGVAGGTGLLALEQVAEGVEARFGPRVEVYGFDTGTGLPKPQDHRDCPNLYSEGTYVMNVEKLRSRLRRAQLLLGLVHETVPRFISQGPPPVAFISFDLDLYSSTMDAFKLLDADARLVLPRIHCYFDDIQGFTFGDFNGERLAIADFNGAHETRTISRLYGPQHFVPSEHMHAAWVERCYMAHIFDHPVYGEKDGLVRQAALDIDTRLTFRYR